MNNLKQSQEELIKKADIQKIVARGQEIYQKIRTQYEPKENGKFLAIEVDNEKEFLANTSADALELAKKEFPDKVFYVVKIGSASAEIMARVILHNEE